MEHRNGTRKPIDIEAIIDYGAGQSVAGRILDISLGGLYLEIPPFLMRAYLPIKLTFNLEGYRGGNEFHWCGTVMRKDQTGVGVMFESADLRNQQGLLGLLRHAETMMRRRLR